ncbi:MAG TPA: M20/M25/M40 family metallo-hydrolase [Candidatus Limnocylindrales bacterium]|nr:M20/M25/M40 family metallo-hydrolase [Candidatus Limnocylindrales bacterium]
MLLKRRFAALTAFGATILAGAGLDDATRRLARDIFQELIEINTTDSVGNVTTAANAMSKRLLDAGFAPADVKVLGPNERKGNLVARIHGSGAARPVLLMGHLDVVEARPEDWTTDPFRFLEKDGYFYGRGTQDMKGNDAALVTTFIRFKKENYRPDRDLILALTADEEGGKSNGVEWLLKQHRDLVDAAFAINADAGGVTGEHGKPVNVDVEASEKLYADFQVVATNPGGHSSLPRPDNAIYELTDALGRLERTPFPVELNAVTRTYFERRAALEPAQVKADMNAVLHNPPDPAAVQRLSKDPRYNSMLRTTCVATRLNAGHANNALPQMAEANVNCRILPGHSPAEIRAKLMQVFADPKLTVKYVDNAGSIAARPPDSTGFPPIMPPAEVLKPLEKVAAEMWPGIPVIPDMETGASDSVYTVAAHIPSYGINGLLIDQDDVRAHGKDERVRVADYYGGVEFYYRYLRALTSR